VKGAVRPLAGEAAADRCVLSMSVSKTVSYEVEHTQRPVFDVSNDALFAAVGGVPILLVIDEHLWPSHGAHIERYAHTRLDTLGICRIHGTEATKTLDSVVELCGRALELGLPRHGAFVAVGGGTILDAVGFAASIYRRGVDYIRVPTTLIGMIDVGVGIKQGVNFRHKKNLLGSFYPPRRTINDVRFLSTLPARQLACGLAEALKIGLAYDGPLFELIEEHGRELLHSAFRSPPPAASEVLLRAELAMMEQLALNLYEADLRRLVDFGHSFSPIIETTTNYAVPHGHAVALDMLLSTAIGVGRTLCDAQVLPRLIQLYAHIGLPMMHVTMSPLLMERALADIRLHRGGALNLVVPTGIGSATFLQDVSYDEISQALQAISAAG
jgi:3-dehydroquinate synthetase